MPGHAGASPPDDFSVENYARFTADLAAKIGADVVVGFSMGATVALEMAVTDDCKRPTVLLGISLSTKDEPAFFRAIVRLGSVFGGLPAAVLAKGAASMVKRAPVSAERQAELRADFAKNVPRDMRHGLREYLRWLRRHEHRAERLCQAGVPTWIVHADKGDGALTADERRTLEECAHTHIVTIPGSVMFLPNEVPERIADVIVQALAAC